MSCQPTSALTVIRCDATADSPFLPDSPKIPHLTQTAGGGEDQRRMHSPGGEKWGAGAETGAMMSACDIKKTDTSKTVHKYLKLRESSVRLRMGKSYPVVILSVVTFHMLSADPTHKHAHNTVILWCKAINMRQHLCVYTHKIKALESNTHAATDAHTYARFMLRYATLQWHKGTIWESPGSHGVIADESLEAKNCVLHQNKEA